MKTINAFLKNYVFYFALLAIFLTSTCGSDKEIPSVCIFDKAPLLNEPSRKEGKILFSVSLGEKVMYLDKTEEDEKGKKYCKVKLLDGSEGWLQNDFVVLNARPALVLQPLDIYSRPDLSTITKKSFDLLDIIAISTAKDDWIEVTGKRKNLKSLDKGWIKNTGFSESTTDIAVALLMNRALSKPKKSDKLAELNSIVSNTTLSGSSIEYKLIEEIRKLDPTAFPEYDNDGDGDMEEIPSNETPSGDSASNVQNEELGCLKKSTHSHLASLRF